MKVILYTAALFLPACLLSCAGSDKEDYVDKDLMKAAAEIKATQKTDSGSSAVQTALQQAPAPVATGTTVPVTAQPVTIGSNVQPVATNVATAPASSTATAPGMNPPHGQPGHRCDIPVGSPLNSKPQTAAPTGTLTTTTTPAPATTTATAPGMNPPHGQPGHRCDIPVGSPLNSKPAAAAISTTPAPPAGVITPKPDTAKNE